MGTAIIVEKKEMVQNYRYQDALDLYKDLKPTLNVTDEQYDMHVKAIKEQGTAPGEHEEIVKEVIPWNYNDRPAGFGEAYLNSHQDHWVGIQIPLPTNWEDYHQGTFKVYFPEAFIIAQNYISVAMSGEPETSDTPLGPAITENFIKEGNIYSAKMLETQSTPLSITKKFITIYLENTDSEFNLELLKKDFRIDFIEEVAPNIQIPGYKSEIYGSVVKGLATMSFSIDSLNMSYNSFEAGLPVTIELGKDRFGNDYSNFKGLMYNQGNESGDIGPGALNEDYSATIANVVPEVSGQLYGKYLGLKISVHGRPATEEDVQHFIENVKIKIG